jgi:hypothetical protein
VREPVIIWGLFVVGLALIGDSIVRGDWAKKIANRKARAMRRRVSRQLNTSRPSTFVTLYSHTPQKIRPVDHTVTVFG